MLLPAVTAWSVTGASERYAHCARYMGIADAGNKVIPKPVLLSAPQQGGDLQVRYFMPHQCHTALAITGAVGLDIDSTPPAMASCAPPEQIASATSPA